MMTPSLPHSLKWNAESPVFDEIQPDLMHTFELSRVIRFIFIKARLSRRISPPCFDGIYLFISAF